ncbi:MAG: C45 family autoproteolytic acyltransferase/hydolase [Desulfobaccales bacterium]
MRSSQALRTLELAGAPQEIGRRHGQTLGAEIRQLRRALLAYLARLSLYAGALPLFGGLLLLARSFLPQTPSRLKQEMAALAAGAQVSPGSVLLINVLDDLANSTPRCSALAVGEGHTRDGCYLMGRNLDYPLFVDILARLQMLFLLEPDEGQALASLAWPGYVGVCTGINKAGVALAQLSVPSRDRSLTGMPAALRFRLALEGGASAAAAADQVLRLPGTIGNNLMLCDAREAMVLELSARRGARRRPRQGLITASNHYQSPAMQALKGRFPPRTPYSPLSPYYFTEAYSQARDRRLQELAAGRRLAPSDLEIILADEAVANAGTVVCVVFAPGERTIWVARGEKPPVNRGPFIAKTLW